jgi:hypothetical protein
MDRKFNEFVNLQVYGEHDGFLLDRSSLFSITFHIDDNGQYSEDLLQDSLPPPGRT